MKNLFKGRISLLYVINNYGYKLGGLIFDKWEKKLITLGAIL